MQTNINKLVESLEQLTGKKVKLKEAVQDSALVPFGEQGRFDMIREACKELGVGDISTLMWVDAKIQKIQANEEGMLLTYGALKELISALFSGQQN